MEYKPKERGYRKIYDENLPKEQVFMGYLTGNCYS